MPQKYKKIGLDFDDVIIDFGPQILLDHNKTRGTSYKIEDMIHFEFERLWGGTRKEAVDRIVEMYDSPDHVCFPPVSGVTKAVKNLKDKYEFVIVTGRPDTARGSIEKWLEKNLPDVINDIYFTNQFRGEKKYSKADFCKMLNIDLFVDDYLPTVLDMSKESIPSILFDAPWNQGELPSNVKRVRTWEEIEGYLGEGKK